MPSEKILSQKARLLRLAGNTTRMKILCVLFKDDAPCVSDIASRIGVSIASISHHLRLLEDNEVLVSRRKGQRICYSLRTNQHMKFLKDFICQ